MHERAARIRTAIAVLILLPFLAATGAAQTLTLGFAGEVVQNRWNPIVFTFRDASNVTLSVRADYGTLRTGAIWFDWSAQIAGGPGLNVFQDDIYLGEWQSLSWSASTSDRVIASGTLNPRDQDPRASDVILSTAPGRHLGIYADGARIAGTQDAALPQRLASWDGVRSLLIDGSTAPPRAAALAAAAAAGAHVMLLTPLPASFDELLLLAPEEANRYGAGYILVGDAGTLARVASELDSQRIDLAALELQLAGINAPPRPPRLALSIVLYCVVTFSVLVLVLLRFAGIAGALTVAALGALLLAVSWSAVRSSEDRISTELELHLSAGGLSRSLQSLKLIDLPGNTVSLAGAWRPTDAWEYRISAGGTSFHPERWQLLSLVRRPVLAEAGRALAPAEAPEFDALLSLLPAGTVLFGGPGLLEAHLP